jgi:hypothetical protein
MGMEGKLRQLSESELAAYRRNPDKLYTDLLGRYNSPDIQNLTAKVAELRALPVVKCMQGRAAAGLPPDPKDVEEYRAKAAALVMANQEAFDAVKSLHIGSSKDGRELSLHKSRCSI